MEQDILLLMTVSFMLGLIVGMITIYAIDNKQSKRTRKQNEYYRRANSNLQYTGQE